MPPTPPPFVMTSNKRKEHDGRLTLASSSAGTHHAWVTYRAANRSGAQTH